MPPTTGSPTHGVSRHLLEIGTNSHHQLDGPLADRWQAANSPLSDTPTHRSSAVLRRDVKLMGGARFVLAEPACNPAWGSITQMFQTHLWS
jgi:hypothetical protein